VGRPFFTLMLAWSFGIHDPREPVNLSGLATLALREIKGATGENAKIQGIHVLDESGGAPCCEKSKMIF
jgi:hypothetical protein